MHTRFESTLTARDCKRHIPLAFAVPGDCERLVIDFAFEPALVNGTHNLVTLSLFDPLGFRGAGHRGGSWQRVRLGMDGATPGYLPGSLTAGTWTVQIDTHMIMPGAALTYRLDVWTLGAGDPEPVIPAGAHDLPMEPAVAGSGDVGAFSDLGKLSTAASSGGPGWYRGDFHTHTYHSDAHGFSVADLVQAARDFDLDFVFLTDHNTVSGLPVMDATQGPGLLLAGGMELTTFWGHALVLGTREWVDWRITPESGGMAYVAAAALANHEVFVMAHPESDGDPGCTGCAWRFGEMMPGNARVIEVWNGPWVGDSNNERALALYYDWLNQGYRLVASAGTDVHGPAPDCVRPGFNVVYAKTLSERAILNGLLAGHLYLSRGPALTVTATDEGGFRWMMGDVVPRPAALRVTWQQCPAGAEIRALANGRLMRRWSATEAGEAAWMMGLDEADWVTIEVRVPGGELLALTNPIYFA